MKITSRPFGITASGDKVTCFDLQNENGMIVSVLDYGCTIQRILVPDQNGLPVDVVLGYDSIEGYENGNCFFGAMVGRYANRIRGGRFSLNGTTYQLDRNDGQNHLHGVFSKRIFDADVQNDNLCFRYFSSSEEEGYPGNLSVAVRYALTEHKQLVLDYEAETDSDTIINLTNHTYFNLNGKGNVLNHSLRLISDRFAECDAETLLTGNQLSVANTPMDFRKPRTIGETIDLTYGQLRLCNGYDHHYVLDHALDELFTFAELIGDQSGIRMTAATTQPGVQLYTGNYVQEDASPFGKGGKRYEKHAGLCLETQHAPDSPNIPAFPSVVLRPGEKYHQETVFQFQI